jgi:hypothetical protein
MSQLQVTGEAKVRDIQGPVVANSGVITALDGDASQYVRGDGTLADFPTSTGGGSSVSYYLNSSVSQGTIGGVAYRQLGKTPIIGAGTDINISANGYVASYLTDANDPALLEVPAGNFNCEFYFSVNSNSHNPFVYAEVYKYDGTTFSLIGTSVGVPEYLSNGTTLSPYYFAIPVSQTVLTITDRIAIRIYVNVDGRTVTLHTENGHLCQVVTTFSKGLTSLNNLTRQVQFLATGTSGTDFGISSATATHTFNLPVASAANTGKLSSTDWSTFNNKQNTITDPITGTGASTQIAYFNSGTSITSEAAFNYDASLNRLGVNTSVPNATIGANAGVDSGYSLLLKSDNANYNSIGFGTDSTYGNMIQADRTGAAPSRNLTLYNYAGFMSLTEAGNLGIGLLVPNTGIDIYNSTNSQLWLHNAASGVTATDGVRLALFNNLSANLRNFDGPMSIASEGDFTVLTLGAENIRVNSADGKVGIGAPATVPEMLTVNGSIQQTGVLSALLKTNSSGKIIAAVAGTDYLAPAALSGYVPTSRTLTINGTAYDLSADRSWTVGTMGGSGVVDRVAFYNGTNSLTSDSGFVYESGANRLGVNTISPNATIGSNAGLDSGYSLLLKNSDTNYNGLGFRIDSTYGHMIETTRTGAAIARNLTLINNGGFFSVSEAGNFGFNILAVNTGVDIYASTNAQLWLHNGANTGSTQGSRLAYFSNKSLNLRNFEGPLSLASEGDFTVLTLGAENIRVNSANGYVGIGNPSSLPSLLTVNGTALVNGELGIQKTSGIATLNFPATGSQNDAAYIQHQESTVDTAIMRFSVGDNDLTNDYFVFGNTQTGSFLERFKILATGVITIGTWNGSAIADAYISSASTWNAKQNQLNGTGFVKASGTTISYDNSTYLTTSAASSTYLALTGGTLTGALGGTSASFSSTLTAGDTTIINVAPILAIQSNTTGNIFLRFRQSADTMASLFYTNATGSFTMSNNIGGLRFNTSGTSDALNIASNGAATFLSSVTANQFISNATDVGGEWYFIKGNAAVSNNFSVYAYSNEVYLNAYSSINIRANNTGGSGGTINLTGGNVGIGTGSPKERFEVAGLNGNIRIYGRSGISSNSISANLYYNGSAWVRDNASYGASQIAFDTSNDAIIFRTTAATSGDAAERMRITSGGNIRLFITPSVDTNIEWYQTPANIIQGRIWTDGNPRVNVQCGGSQGVYLASGGVAWIANSDERLKTDLVPIEDAINKVNSLRSVIGRYKTDIVGTKRTFLIAQDLIKVLPEVVTIDEKTGDLGVSYSEVIPLLVAAIKEQQLQIQELKALINK